MREKSTHIECPSFLVDKSFYQDQEVPERRQEGTGLLEKTIWSYGPVTRFPKTAVLTELSWPRPLECFFL